MTSFCYKFNYGHAYKHLWYDRQTVLKGQTGKITQ